MNPRTIVVGIVTLICLSQPYHLISGKQPPPASQAYTAQDYYEQGNNYLRADRCSEAVEAFRKSLDLRASTGAYNDLGRAYMCLVKYPEAVASFKQAIRVNPNNMPALYNLGVAYARQMKIEDANNVLLELRSKDPQRAKELQDEIGNARVAKRMQGEAESAIAGAKKALEALKKKDPNYEDEGDKYSETKDYVKAIEAYKKAISLRPSSYAYNGLGLAYDALKQYPNAVSAFQQAIRIEPHQAIHYNLATVYIEMGEYEKSQSSSREALRLKPDYADAINLLGVAHMRLKQYPEAAAEFQRAIRLAPNDGVLYHNLGKAYFLMGRKQDAQRIYRKLVTLDKESAQRLHEVMNPIAKKSNF